MNGWHIYRQRDSGSVFYLAAIIFAYVVFLMMAIPLAAQDLEPRAYSASPTGLNFLAIGVARSSGGIIFDPSIPVMNVQAHINSPVIGVGRTFGLFRRQALITGSLPYAFGRITGDVGPQLQQASITRSGLTDLRVKLSINLRGSPALPPREFAKARHRSLLIAASMSVQVSSGQYSPTKLINLGNNRWALRPELGMSYPWKKFYFDLYAGAWFFGENSSFFPGDSIRQQYPLSSLQAHISYSLRPQLWFALDGTWYTGGDTIVNNGPSQGRQNNSRLGVTCSFPLGKQQSLKIAYSDGVIARFGTNFSTLSLVWQFRWFGHETAQ